jgi:glycosyltransferase involved in cell wall biosynthesis
MAFSVSVALCTYNSARFIDEQVRSILEQELMPDEIVVSDDGSTDDTVERIRAAAKSSGNTAILRVLPAGPRLGVTANFQRAVSACVGDLIALSDHDDSWRPDHLSSTVPMFSEQPDLLLVHGDARLVDEAGQPTGSDLFESLGVSPREFDELEHGHAFDAYLRRNLVTGATTVFRRSLLKYALPFPSEWVHDEWLGFIAAAIGRVAVSRRVQIDYRQHGANQIGVRKLNFPGKVRRVLEPRSGRNRYLYERAQVLQRRLEQLGTVVPEERLALASGKVEHQRVRAALSRSRPKRWIPVLREAATGRYSLFSRGTADIVRDLFQPAGVEN